MSILFDSLTELRLDISPEIHRECWQAAQAESLATHQWHRYLNQVCLRTVLPWLQAEQEPTARAWTDAPVDQRGAAIAIGDKRLVLIPDKTLDTSELRVPQAWLDHAEEAGDYFLAVQVDPDELWLRVWGYTTHQTLTTKGEIDLIDHTYCLDAHQLVRDLSVLWVVRQLYSTEPTQAAILPILDRSVLPLPVIPTLELPRSGAADQLAAPGAIVRLGQWLDQQVEDGWQTLESLLGSQPELAYSLRKIAGGDNRAVRRVKRVSLPDQDILLMVEVEPDRDDRIGIRIQLRSLDDTSLLPSALSLTLRAPSGETIQSVETREHDNLVQLKYFRCPPGTEFSLHLEIAHRTITGHFIV